MLNRMRANQFLLNDAKTEILCLATSLDNIYCRGRRHASAQPKWLWRMLFVISVTITILIYQWDRTSKQTVSSSFAVLRQLRIIRRFVMRAELAYILSLYRWFLIGSTAAMRHLPAFLLASWNVCSPSWTLLFGWSIRHQRTNNISHRFFVNYTGWELQSGLTSNWPSSSTNVCTNWPPSYHADELRTSSDFAGRRLLRSTTSSALIVRRTCLSSVGDRAFPVETSRVWNRQLQHITSAHLLTVFKSRLKTQLFTVSFP